MFQNKQSTKKYTIFVHKLCIEYELKAIVNKTTKNIVRLNALPKVSTSDNEKLETVEQFQVYELLKK